MVSDLVLQKLEKFFKDANLVRYYKKGEIIVRADDDPSGVFYVREGYARIYSVSPNGQEITFNIFKPGSFFPMMWAIGQSQNTYFLEAMSAVELWRAPKDKLVEFIKREPEVLFDLTRRILIGLDGLLGVIESLLFGDARAKIASVVAVSAKRFGQKKQNGEIEIALMLTHQNIASLAGLTRETVSAEMKKLENEGLISYNKRLLVIKKMDKLEELSFTKKELPHIL